MRNEKRKKKRETLHYCPTIVPLFSMSTQLNGRVGLSADMAIRFEKTLGLKANTLCRMQTTHDFAAARQHEKKIKVKAFGVTA